MYVYALFELQGEIEHHDEDFKAPRTDGKPLLLKESQSFISKVAKDSTHTSGQKNVTYKTTDGDLSADMFFGCTGNIENTQGFVYSLILMQFLMFIESLY